MLKAMASTPPWTAQDCGPERGLAMSAAPDDAVEEENNASPRLALLLAAAMFVLVIDTSLMNVSISAVIKDLHTTASGVQSAIALEALVSAAFILTNSKMGDLMGRKRAYVIGLLAYAIGALAMTAGAEPDRHHHLLGDHRRAWRIPPAPGDAVPDSRQLHGRRSEASIRTSRRIRRDRSRCRSTPGRVPHDLSVVACRLRTRGASSSWSCCPRFDSSRMSPTRGHARSTRRRSAVRRRAWAASSSASSSGRRAVSTSA